MCVCVWKGAGDNYIEVVETGGLLIPNAVTLIKAEREGGVLQTAGCQFNSEQKKKKSCDLSHWPPVVLFCMQSRQIKKNKKKALCVGASTADALKWRRKPLRMLGKKKEHSAAPIPPQ